MDGEPVFALLRYCVIDPDQENNSCVPTFLIASLCETCETAFVCVAQCA